MKALGHHRVESHIEYADRGGRLEAIATWEWRTNDGWAFPFPSEYDSKVDTKKMFGDALAPARAAHPEVHVQSFFLEGHTDPSWWSPHEGRICVWPAVMATASVPAC
jgi:hypothetical protein